MGLSKRDAMMAIYSDSDTIESLSKDQLDLIARSNNDYLLDFIAEKSAYDVNRIRLMLEPGRIEARARLSKLNEVK